MEKDKKKLIRDPRLLISHMILEEGQKKEFIDHFHNLGDKVDVKVIIGGYEINCDSFQEYFLELWNRTEERYKKTEDELVKNAISGKIQDLISKLDDMNNFVESTTNSLIDNIDW